MDIRVGTYYYEKPHPCGNNQLNVLRIGMNFRLQCQGCSMSSWLAAPKIEKRVKKGDKAAGKKACGAIFQLNR